LLIELTGEVNLIKIISWNMGKRSQPWRDLLETDADIALLQEVGSVPDEVAGRLEIGEPHHYGAQSASYDRWPMIVRLSDRVEIQRFRQTGFEGNVAEDEIAVSCPGTVAAARIIPLDGQEPFLAFSMYSRWLNIHPASYRRQIRIYSDASTHRIISDISAFIGHLNPATHRILAAGDLNVIYGALEGHHLELPQRAQSVFDRMRSIGLEFIGPRYPHGRQANPPAVGLPKDTANVPTYFTTRETKETAQNQLDYVFASKGFHQGIQVRALNEIEEWGSSDHCRITIDVEQA